MNCKQHIKNAGRLNSLTIWALFALLSVWTGNAYSQQDSDNNKSNRRQSQVLSTSLSRTMFEVQEALLDENYNDALFKLTSMLSREDDLKSYDKAKILEMLTVVHTSLEDYRQAAQTAEQALRLDVLEESSSNQLHQRLFYLHFFLEDYARAIEHIEVWFELEPSPDIQSYFTAAQIYALSEQMDKALSFALKGMDVLRSMPERKPREDWYQLLISIHFRTKQYSNAAGVLEQALSLWPHRLDYYLQLSAVYQELNRERESLAILSIAYQNKLLNKEVDFDRILQLYRYFDYPFKGASIFSYELNREKIRPDEENWQKLANTWLQARERSQAEGAFQQAARLSDTGKHWLRLCQIAFQEERWADSQRYCKAAIKKGGLEDEEGSAWYLVALGRYYQDQIVEAQEVFKRCMGWPDTQSDCEQWHSHLTQVLRDRQAELERMQQESVNNEKRRQQLQQEIDKTLI